jgi:hypothetical protein
MATNSTIGQVDRLLDEVQLTREDLRGQVQSCRTLVLRVRHMERELYDELMAIEAELAGPDDENPGGGLFHKVSDVRSHRAIRKAQPWDGKTFRRKADRHLRAA